MRADIGSLLLLGWVTETAIPGALRARGARDPESVSANIAAGRAPNSALRCRGKDAAYACRKNRTSQGQRACLAQTRGCVLSGDL